MVLFHVKSRLKKKINDHLNIDPEKEFRWEGDDLVIEHPKKKNSPIMLRVSKNQVEASYNGNRRAFKINRFSRFDLQVENICNSWPRELLEEYCESNMNTDLEFHLYDSEYEYVKTM